MGELDESLRKGQSDADVQAKEGSPLGIVVISMLLLAALIIWYRFK